MNADLSDLPKMLFSMASAAFVGPYAAAQHVRRTPMHRMHEAQHVVALDFDGVIVDSEPEVTRAAWRATCLLWPDVAGMAAEAEGSPWTAGARKAWAGGEWEPLRGSGPDGLPNWLAAKMRLLRPIVETGYETVLLLRLCVEEAQMSARSDRAQRPLSVGEIAQAWEPELVDGLLVRFGLSRDEAIRVYGEVRDAWLAKDEAGWLAANSFYDGAIASVRHALEAPSSDTRLYIVTKKYHRFAQRLLQSAGVSLPDGDIFALGSGPKTDTLAELQRRHPGCSLAFVEDRAETVRAVARDPRLLGVQLYFARWGYSNDGQNALASSMPRVRALSEPSQLALAMSPRRTSA